MQKMIFLSLGIIVFSATVAIAAPQGGRAGTTIRTPVTVQPTGSQRRDGTFATTGTTASGGINRPTTGQGVQNGSGVNK